MRDDKTGRQHQEGEGTSEAPAGIRVNGTFRVTCESASDIFIWSKPNYFNRIYDMSKRPYEDDTTDRPPKRARPEQPRAPAPVEDIQFARQLTQLLTFRQDGIPHLLHAVRSFKAFLESILYHRDEDDRARQLSILREYLESQRPAELKDLERPMLGQLWQAWSFANQNNNDHLASSVSAILALLLRTLSSLLDFRDLGLLLCRTVLQHQHLRLLKRGLDAPKHKEFVISPCLRLVTEVTSFDGGVLAREVYKQREQTFDVATLRRNLGLVKIDIPEDEAKRKPSMRTLTVRYVLAHLKYQREGAKIDILKSRPLCIALFQFVRDDPSEFVNEILSQTEQYVLKDSELPRSAKATLLTQHNLERVTEVATRSSDDHPAAAKAFAWLKAVCTTQSYGILRDSGWYPPGTTKRDIYQTAGNDTINLGLDSLEFYDATDRPDVRNTTLLAWLQTLRPQSDLKERELFIACFESAPELVAAYFAEKSMQLDPKLSNTWIGYASFLFEVIRLATPTRFGHNEDDEDYAALPPQTNIVLENLLPKPLSQKILTRCLNQSSELITFFAVRLLILALQKLSDIQTAMRNATETSLENRDLWSEASQRLTSRFAERAPLIKDIINVFRKIPDDDDHALQREAVTRLLRLYHEVTPVQALEEQFDVSSPLVTALARDKADGEIGQLRVLELQHLLSIAQHSPGMRWFNKQGSLPLSPVCMLLRIHTSDCKDRKMRRLLTSILEESNIVHGYSPGGELDALVASLLSVEANDVWSFIDDCMSRVHKQPVKYLDQLEAVAEHSIVNGLLMAVVAEQTSFALERPEVLSWIHRYFALLCNASGHSQAAVAFRATIVHLTPADDDAWRIDILSPLDSVKLPASEQDTAVSDAAMDVEFPALPFTQPPAESDNRPELLRWAQKDLELAIEEGDIDALMLCLCSSQGDVRRQAHNQLDRLGAKLRDSTIEDKDQLYVLIGELMESYEQQYAPQDRALPYLAGTFATRALHVMLEPTHFLYPKLNRFLMRGPEWRVSRLPAYWLSNTIDSQPSEDDAYWKEVHWVLDWLADGLRSPADLDNMRRGGVFEKVMAVYSSPAASVKLVREKIMELLFRATCVEGGSTMLITRTGVLAWCEMVGREKGSMAVKMKQRLLETCDQERIRTWGGYEVETL